MESLRQDALRRLVVEEKRADVAESARASAEKENARLREHTKKANDLVLELARKAALDLGFELGPEHDVRGLLFGALQAAQIGRESRKQVAEITRQREEALEELKIEREFKQRVFDALGNGRDDRWKPGEHWTEAVRRLVAESSSLAQKAQEAESTHRMLYNFVERLAKWPVRTGLPIIRDTFDVARLARNLIDEIDSPKAVTLRALPSAPATPESVNNRLTDTPRDEKEPR
jgi:hypothetical protein